MILLLILLLAACGDLSLEPVEEWPLWCDERAHAIEGQWGREFVNRDHQYRTAIQIEAIGPCEFEYAVLILQQADEGHDAARIHLSLGSLAVVGYEQSGPVGLLTIESRRARQENRRSDGATEVDSMAQMFNTQIAKLWGEGLTIWGNYYTRKD